jgi:SNW domain-containing protein 1
MSLLAALPAPKQQHQTGHVAPAPVQKTSTALTTTGREAPPYPRRKGFVPRRQEDFKDGE